MLIYPVLAFKSGPLQHFLRGESFDWRRLINSWSSLQLCGYPSRRRGSALLSSPAQSFCHLCNQLFGRSIWVKLQMSCGRLRSCLWSYFNSQPNDWLMECSAWVQELKCTQQSLRVLSCRIWSNPGLPSPDCSEDLGWPWTFASYCTQPCNLSVGGPFHSLSFGLDFTSQRALLTTNSWSVLRKCDTFKLRFQANYWTNQLETNASNSSRTWSFWGGIYCL